MKALYYRLTNKIPFVNRRRQRKLLLKVGASFLKEINTNQNFRQFMIKNSPLLVMRLKKMGITVKRK